MPVRHTILSNVVLIGAAYLSGWGTRTIALWTPLLVASGTGLYVEVVVVVVVVEGVT